MKQFGNLGILLKLIHIMLNTNIAEIKFIFCIGTRTCLSLVAWNHAKLLLLPITTTCKKVRNSEYITIKSMHTYTWMFQCENKREVRDGYDR